MENDEIGPNVLIIDDEKNIRMTLSMCLENIGCTIKAVKNENEAVSALSKSQYDLVFLDLKLESASGLDILPRLLEKQPNQFVVMITAYATFDSAVEATKRGAWDFLPKPFTPAQIRIVVEKFHKASLNLREQKMLMKRFEEEVPEVLLETNSKSMQIVLEMAKQVSTSDAAVLLRGESGTGKGVLARWIHERSRRSKSPFVSVNCPTLSNELLVSELFGHTKGAFTGAVRDQVGRVEEAQGGTLFLDEIGEISVGLQTKLLRFLQDKSFERVGDPKTRKADVRIIAATNRHLESDVKQGRFREDLFYRLNVVDLTVPALRERVDDILPLARNFLAFFSQSMQKHLPTISPEVEKILRNYSWPGNVRELRNAMERALIFSDGQSLSPNAFSLPNSINLSCGIQLGDHISIEEVEREHIARVVSSTSTLEEASKILGIETSTLWRKRKKLEGG